jgi:plasmid stabilization system protein ParE
MSDYDIEFAATAKDDLDRLHSFYANIDSVLADHALDTILSAFQTIQRHPYICRTARQSELGSRWRELLIDFGRSGFVALFEIESDSLVRVVAVRHQREADYH